MNRGTLYVISAPSGTGKSTIVHRILDDDPNVKFSVSATTRQPRQGEIDGVDYYFKTREEFMELVQNGGMLEHAEFCGNCYGTPREPVFEKLAEGFDVILEIETVGAMQVMKSCPEAVGIFILPPSLAELKNRLVSRATDSEEVIDRRVAEARAEIEKSHKYDFAVINDDLEQAITDVKSVMHAAKYLTKQNNETIEGVLKKC